MNENETKILEVNGYSIESNSCKGINVRIFDKFFGQYLMPNFPENLHDNNISISHIKLMELVKQASLMSVILDDAKTYLRIETSQYTVVADIPQSEVSK